MAKNPISIEVLETLDAIDRRGSYAKAAEELNKATSALSYLIQRLEEQLDLSLFQRQGRRSVLTPAGRLVLEEGREILKSTARLADRAKEVATGWEPRIRIAIESLQSYERVFAELAKFLSRHPSIEIDVCESVLNGGWEALDRGRVDLLIGAPGPVPLQKGYRAIPMPHSELVPVIAAHHLSCGAEQNLAAVRRVVSHDTSISDVAKTAGLAAEGEAFFVQNIDQKCEAIRAGIGIGHLPRHRIQALLDSGELVALSLPNQSAHESFLAWKIANKGKGLRALTQQLSQALNH